MKMKLNSIFLVIIVAIFSLTGCSVNKQPVKQVSDTNTTKSDNTNKKDNTLTDKNDSPILLSTIDDAKNSTDFNFTNGYKSKLLDGSVYIIVEVGALKADSKQGIAIIKQVKKDVTGPIREQKLLTPEKHGSIKVDTINGDNMIVVAEDAFSWTLNAYTGFTIEPQKELSKDKKLIENNNLPIELPSIDDVKNSKDIVFTNGYKSGVNQDGTYIIAELGALKADPKQGIVVIKTINKDGMKILNEQKLLTPEKHGTIKVDGINAFNLGAKAADGYSWILNVSDGFR